ncbi:MAG: energy transducer TonB [Bacteroidota bacterium]
MKPKKTIKANLENKRSVFFKIGLVLTLAIVFTAFEWSTKAINSEGWDDINLTTDETDYLPPITEHLKPKPPEPPKIIPTELKPVDKDVETPINFITNEPVDSVIFTFHPPISKEPDETVYEQFEISILPEFPGGEEELLKWIKKATKYPEIAKENGISGRVFIDFVINKQGKVTDVMLKNGVDPYLDAEAIRVVKLMPDWKPGFHNGDYVKVHYTIPIKFKLDN